MGFIEYEKMEEKDQDDAVYFDEEWWPEDKREDYRYEDNLVRQKGRIKFTDTILRYL